jgi:prepilin-type N-terminal cleavage/methylation domain-containing protein
MKSKLPKQTSGFTIIEVVLVLAIAGLIFLIVFLAVPALQRSQRDTQRRSDVGRTIAQLQSYASNRNGTYPNTAAEVTNFVSRYMTSNGSSFNDPSTGSTYAFTRQTALTSLPSKVGDMYYYTNATCTNGALATGNGNRSIAVLAYMEASGDLYCQSN